MEYPQYKFVRMRRDRVAPTCPCGRSNADGKFVPIEGYTDKGFCHSCGKSFFPDAANEELAPVRMREISNEIKPQYVPLSRQIASQQEVSKTTFFKWLCTFLGERRAQDVSLLYRIGADPDGGVIFWQINRQNMVCTAQKIFYGDDGHRLKDRHPARLYTITQGYRGCMFGEHLLPRYPKKAIGIVESEKTAMICSVFIPDKVWLACGGMNGLTYEKIQVLRGQKVFLYPDAHAEARAVWRTKASEIAKIAHYVEVVDMCPEDESKQDIADFILLESQKHKRRIIDNGSRD